MIRMTEMTVMTRVSGMTGMNRRDTITTGWHKIFAGSNFSIFPATCNNMLTWMTGMTCLARMNRMTID